MAAPRLPAPLLAPSPLARLRLRLGDLAAWARDTLDAELEQRRGFLWTAAGFMAGAGLYFVLPAEPALAALAVVALGFAGAAFLAWRRDRAFRLLALAAALAAGTTAAKLRVVLVDAPQITAPVVAELSGRVRAAEQREGPSLRLVLDRLAIAGIAPEATPERLRLTFRGSASPTPIGARVSLRARLVPLPEPAIPGGYDFRRAAFFDRLGGTGIVLGAVTVLSEPPRRGALALKLADLRPRMTARYAESLPGEAGAIAAALLVGERSLISAASDDALRAAGLSHVLSISGLHMVLIAGTAFAVARLLLALIPGLALAFPIKRWAALVGLVAAAVYLGLSGGGAATVRSFVMAEIGFLAILAGRPALSMRNLALALFVTVAMEPEGVVEPGFQMSFAAVAALVAGFEAWRDRPRQRLAEPVRSLPLRLALKAAQAIAVTCATTLIAGLATAPYASYHFGRIATLSLLGNLLAMPVVSLVVMPAGLFALALYPLGLEAVPLALMGQGIEAMLAIARFVASLPGALVAMPPLPTVSLLLATFGLLWLTLWQRRWRLLGLVPLVLSPALAPLLVEKPDVIVSGEGRMAAIRRADGGLAVLGGRPGSFGMAQWFERDGLTPPDPARLREGVSCDALGCVARLPDGREVALARRFEAFAEDCARAAVIVSALPAPPNCRAPVVLDKLALAKRGTTVLRFMDDGRIEERNVRTAGARAYVWERPGAG